MRASVASQLWGKEMRGTYPMGKGNLLEKKKARVKVKREITRGENGTLLAFTRDE